MTTIRKLNRNSGPVRVTQRGTRTDYPAANWRKQAAKASRYHGHQVVEYQTAGACLTADEVADGIEALLRAVADNPERFRSVAQAAYDAVA